MINAVLLGMIGTQEIILIVVAILILFGGRKIPELMKGLGKGIREFNDAKNNVKSEIEDGIKEKDKDEEIRRLREQVNQQKQPQ
ncbi:MAG TPA: twin-arginine translocase TatA/TatE family subunit [Ferruginibacter sp.]|nr:twin-arginine translocase TatA/TatE family subunit [Ferruginibacter sp.]HPH90401.1 twin-arginine translocase TatA/TatE family subunit [Ferruginibacter sp.]